MSDRRRTAALVLAVGMVALALALAGALPAGAREVPFLSGRVVDEADLLPPDREAALTEELRLLEEETGAQVVVLTVPSLEGEVLEDYSLRVAETWGIGRGEVDDGAVLLVARDDRQLRIEVGYGLEGTLPDLAASRIIRNVIVPRFKAGDFPGGIEEGVASIAGAIRKEPGAVPPDPPSPQGGFEPGCVVFPIVFFLFFVLPILRASRGGRRGRRRSGFPIFIPGSFGGGGGGGGSFGGGGFSGGGGSFGGGGASGSW